MEDSRIRSCKPPQRSLLVPFTPALTRIPHELGNAPKLVMSSKRERVPPVRSGVAREGLWISHSNWSPRKPCPNPVFESRWTARSPTPGSELANGHI
jgi:hypothetical protein